MLNEMKVNEAELNEQELIEAAGGDWLDDLKEWGNTVKQKGSDFLDNVKERAKKVVEVIEEIVLPKPVIPGLPVLPPDQPIL